MSAKLDGSYTLFLLHLMKGGGGGGATTHKDCGWIYLCKQTGIAVLEGPLVKKSFKNAIEVWGSTLRLQE